MDRIILLCGKISINLHELKKILLLSDTHGCSEDDIVKHFKDADELWHAGDWTNLTLNTLMEKTGKPIRGVWGNVDGHEIRAIYPLHNKFVCEGLKVWMTHIGGYPGKYNPKIRVQLQSNPPDIFICGHSHILKVMRDPKLNNMLCINPGAAGRHGFHLMRTMIKFEMHEGKIQNMAAIELGKRTAGILPDIQ
ncbi:MAG: metallophosphoesterase family protein [Candidatus Paceibacterota bacterium]